MIITPNMCPHCRRILGTVATCTANTTLIYSDGEHLKPVPCDVDICTACGVHKGYSHHAGCPLEKCPRCFEVLDVCHCGDDVYSKEMTSHGVCYSVSECVTSTTDNETLSCEVSEPS